MTWIAAAESLKARFSKMGQRDSQIGRVAKTIHDMESARQPTDAFVLKSAKEFDLLSADEYVKLDHILTLRNIYAHPLGVDPQPVEVVAAISLVVETVLSRPLLLRHGYVSEVVRKLLQDRHFLDDVESVAEDHARSVTRRVHPTVLPYLFERLVKDLEPLSGDPESALYWRRGLAFGISFLEEASPEFSSPEWDLARLIELHPHACSQILSAATVWPKLPTRIQDSVLGHLIEPTAQNQAAEHVQPADIRRALVLRAEGQLTERQRSRLLTAIQAVPYDALTTIGAALPDYLDRVIEDLSSHDWYVQNPAAAAVESAGSQGILALGPVDQTRLGRSILQAAEGGAWGAGDVISAAERSIEDFPAAFVLGVALECFTNESLQFRAKTKWLPSALEMTALHPAADDLFSALLASISESEPKRDYLAEYDLAIEAVERARRSSDVAKEVFDELLDVLKTKSVAYPSIDD